MSSEQPPSVTVVVPTRGRPRELERALRSIVAQRYDGPIECVVVFDREEPSVPPVEAGPSRTVSVLANDRTPGPAGARNTGALAARGEILAFCDDDDEWLPDKTRLQVDALARGPLLAVGCGVTVEYQGSTATRTTSRRVVTFSDVARSRVVQLNMTTLALWREGFADVGPFDEAIPGSYAEDYEWLLRATRLGTVGIVPEPLARIHWKRSPRSPESYRTIVAALEYLLAKHPELAEDRKGLARIYGQIAFAHAAAGEVGEARRWAARALGLHGLEPRAYVAGLASVGLAPPRTITHLAHRFGRGVI